MFAALQEGAQRRSIDQPAALKARVRKTYEILAQQHGVKWKRRKYDPADWDAGDVANRCLSSATACLHG